MIHYVGAKVAIYPLKLSCIYSGVLYSETSDKGHSENRTNLRTKDKPKVP